MSIMISGDPLKPAIQLDLTSTSDGIQNTVNLSEMGSLDRTKGLMFRVTAIGKQAQFWVTESITPDASFNANTAQYNVELYKTKTFYIPPHGVDVDKYFHATGLGTGTRRVQFVQYEQMPRNTDWSRLRYYGDWVD